MFNVGRYRGDAIPAIARDSKTGRGGEKGKGRPKREHEGGKGKGGAKQARGAGKDERGKGGPRARADSNVSERSERSDRIERIARIELLQPSVPTPQAIPPPAEAPAAVAAPAFANMKAAAAKAALEAASKAELKSKKKRGKANKVRRVPIEAILGPLNDEDGAAANEKADAAATTQGDSKGTHARRDGTRATPPEEVPLAAGGLATAAAAAEAVAVPSVAADALAWGVDPRLLAALQAQGVKHFFPVQRQVIPETLAAARRPALLARDVCVGAATGSGKTLVFVVTVLQALLGRQVPRVRALVVLPSRSLALQVFEEFQKYAPAVGLRVGLATGQRDFAHEQLELTGARPRHPLLPAHPPAPPWCRAAAAGGSSSFGSSSSSSGSGAGCVDIVVCTPGRLVDHLERTPGLTLEHLRFLVVDEADRLLNQSYNAWVEKVLAAAYRQVPGTAAFVQPGSGGAWRLDLKPATARAHPGAAADAGANAGGAPDSATTEEGGGEAKSLAVVPVPLLRLLFSATLSANPQKLAALGLVNPKFYALTSSAQRSAAAAEDQDDSGASAMALPATLTELVVRVATGGGAAGQTKPLLLLALLRRILAASAQSFVLVFASSLDSTHRLARLLQLALPNGASEVFEFTGGLASLSHVQAQQRQSLAARRAPTSSVVVVRVVVCSDGLARGVDLPGVSHVLNYDAPTSVQAYVHRVGRTARAGRRGVAATLVKGGQASSFRELRAQLASAPGGCPDAAAASNGVVAELRVPAKECSGVHLAAYQRALTGLAELLRLEAKGELRPTDPPPSLDALAPAAATQEAGAGDCSDSSSSSTSSSSSDSESESSGSESSDPESGTE